MNKETEEIKKEAETLFKLIKFVVRNSKMLAALIVVLIINIILTAITNIILNDPLVQKFIEQSLFRLIDATPVWGTTIALSVSGFILFWFRNRFRWQYGIIEYIVGFITAILVFLPASFDYSQVKYSAYFQVLGGAYIMVRGLDNFNIGAKGSRLEKYWNNVFGKQTS